MRKMLLILCTILLGVFSMGMSFASTDKPISYNNISIGSTLEDVRGQFGTERYTESDYAWGHRLTYYVYKNGNKIGVDADTGKVADISIVDDTYNSGTDLKMGATTYKIEKFYGPAKRQLIEGKTAYAYKDKSNVRIVLTIEPDDRSLAAVRMTSLPIELPFDDTAYVPDDATSEEENPLIADKTVDTSEVEAPRGSFKIHYDYSVTK